MATAPFSIRPMSADDGPRVLAIYRQGIATGDATFETSVPAWEAWDRKHLSHSRVVAHDRDELLGWTALSPLSDRCVYAGVAEVSVYVAQGARGRGVGGRLLETLVRESEAAGIWTLQAGIFPENHASLAIHRRCGFRVVGVRERIGQMQGRWRDVMMLERRSAVAGRA